MKNIENKQIQINQKLSDFQFDFDFKIEETDTILFIDQFDDYKTKFQNSIDLKYYLNRLINKQVDDESTIKTMKFTFIESHEESKFNGFKRHKLVFRILEISHLIRDIENQHINISITPKITIELQYVIGISNEPHYLMFSDYVSGSYNNLYKIIPDALLLYNDFRYGTQPIRTSLYLINDYLTQ